MLGNPQTHHHIPKDINPVWTLIYMYWESNIGSSVVQSISQALNRVSHHSTGVSSNNRRISLSYDTLRTVRFVATLWELGNSAELLCADASFFFISGCLDAAPTFLFSTVAVTNERPLYVYQLTLSNCPLPLCKMHWKKYTQPAPSKLSLWSVSILSATLLQACDIFRLSGAHRIHRSKSYLRNAQRSYICIHMHRPSDCTYCYPEVLAGFVLDRRYSVKIVHDSFFSRNAQASQAAFDDMEAGVGRQEVEVRNGCDEWAAKFMTLSKKSCNTKLN